MKDQYFGDIWDFGKYLLLRHLTASGVSIGINWYLTKGDSSNDGRMTDYLLKKEKQLRHLDADLFDTLREMVITKKQRNCVSSENSSLLEDPIYYYEMLDISDLRDPKEKRIFRREWHRKALNALSDAELIYFDPDNGIADADVSGKKDSVKYLLTSEAADYYTAGHNIVYYCHKGRRKDDAWSKYKNILKNGRVAEHFSDARLIYLTFRRGVQRSFIFAIHPEDYNRYRNYID